MKKKLIIFLYSIIIVGCNVAKREIQKLQVYAVRYPNDFKILANTLDPCFGNTVVHSDTVVKVGKRDTVQLAGSTVITRVKDTVIKTITLPGRQVTIPTFVTIRDTVADKRGLEAANSIYRGKSDSLIVVQTQLAIKSHAKNIWMYIALGLGLLDLIYIIIAVYKFLNGGAIASTVKKII